VRRVAGALLLLAVAACGTASSSPEREQPARTPASGAASVPVAPWVDVTAAGMPDLVPLARRGIGVVNLGFVTAAGDTCRPAWGGVRAVADPLVAGEIGRFRAAGGDVRVSFGGADGVELARACPTSAALAAAYAQVIDALGVRLVDLDVEGDDLADAEANRRRNEALHRLEADAEEHGRPLRISYTLPAEPTGLTPPAQALLRGARAEGVEVDAVDVLAMDYGGAPTDLVAAGVGAAGGAEAFVRGLASAEGGDAFSRIALTAMIGVNDLPGQVLQPADLQRLAAFARARGLAWVSFWSLGRDRPCSAGDEPVSPACSGVDAPAGAFLAAVSSPAGAGPAG
jgi:hypothetical protein